MSRYSSLWARVIVASSPGSTSRTFSSSRRPRQPGFRPRGHAQHVVSQRGSAGTGAVRVSRHRGVEGTARRARRRAAGRAARAPRRRGIGSDRLAPEPPDRAGAERRRRRRTGRGRASSRPSAARSARRTGRGRSRRRARSIRRRCCTRSSRRRPDGSARTDRRAAHPAARHDAAHQRAGRAEPGEPASLRDRVGGRDRCGHGVHPPQRHHPAARGAPAALRGRAGRLRVLTTTYTGSTEGRALDQLADLGADVRISYDLSTTRLHAKAWVFHRRSGFSTAYVGSSNLTHSAQVTGLEWNVRIAAARNPDIVAKFGAVFDSYWESGDFVRYDPERVRGRAAQEPAGPIPGPHVILSPIELRPEPFQERLLELIEVVAGARPPPQPPGRRQPAPARPSWPRSTTPRLRSRLDRSRLLFIAHREEILDASLATFRYALREPSFGEKWVGGARPTRVRARLRVDPEPERRRLDDLAPDHFDVVIVDEFHHAAAASYEQRARPPRSGRAARAHRHAGTQRRAADPPVVRRPHRRRAAAVGRDRPAAPVAVPVLRHPRRPRPSTRSRGGAVVATTSTALTNLYTSTDAWARFVVDQVAEHADPATDAMPRVLREHRARPVHGAALQRATASAPSPSGATARSQIVESALKDLAAGGSTSCSPSTCSTRASTSPTSTPFSCSGRRRARRCSSSSSDEDCARRPTRATARCSTSSAPTARSSASTGATGHCSAAAAGNSSAPCSSTSRSCRRAATCSSTGRRPRSSCGASEMPFPASGRPRSTSCDRCGATGRTSTWPTYLDETGLDLEDVYSGSRSWSDLREAAGADTSPAGPSESVLRRAVGRLLHVDDHERISTYRRLLAHSAPPEVDGLPVRERRLLHMLAAAAGDQALTKDASVQDAVDLLWSHPQVLAELQEVFAVLDGRVDHVHRPLSTHPEVPLQIHARYSRIEILAAFGLGGGGKIAAWQSGVYEAKDANAELLAFTLDKSSGGFSPTTRYRDYAISRTLIHWESQSSTRERQRHRPPLPQPGTRRPLDPALHPTPHRRPSLLVPRPGHLPRPRRREADGDHVGAGASALGRPVLRIRCRRRLSTPRVLVLVVS